MKNIIKYIEDLQYKHVPQYDLTEKTFNVGDIAYVMFEENPIKVIITDIEDYSTKEANGCIYYWIEPLNISKIEKIWNKLNFYFYYYFPFAHKFYTYHPSGKYPGHSVSAGLGEYLHKTKEECELNYHFNEVLWHLDILEYELKEK